MPTPNTRILLLTGDGKGKTTAALGLILRAVGHGMRAALIHFIKADRTTGETQALERLPEVDIHFCGCGFVRQPTPARLAIHREAAARGLDLAGRYLRDQEVGMVVLDEVCGAVTLGLLDRHDVVAAVRGASAGTIVVLTGRGAVPELIDLADTVSRIECVKHGLDSGHPARPGVEF
jgi:cob(I)alamin adenosyltransferase